MINYKQYLYQFHNNLIGAKLKSTEADTDQLRDQIIKQMKMQKQNQLQQKNQKNNDKLPQHMLEQSQSQSDYQIVHADKDKCPNMRIESKEQQKKLSNPANTVKPFIYEKIMMRPPKQNSIFGLANQGQSGEGGIQPKNPHFELSHINYLSLQSLQSSLGDQIPETYQSCIMSNQSIIYNSVVAHLTTGCNILYSIFAAQAGARKVYCIINGTQNGELQRKNLYMMRQIILENGMENIISCGCYRQFGELGVKVDVIIGEPMGYNLIYDGLLDRMIEIRDLYMRDTNKGLIIPSKIKYKCAFIKDERFVDKKIQFWNQVYGVNMTAMKFWISGEPMVRFVDPSLIVSQVTKFLDFDISTTTYEEIDNINKKFSIKTPITTTASGLTTWFDLQFPYANGQIAQIKTAPFFERTKWTQMTLYSKKQLQLEEGKLKNIEFSGKKNHIEGSTVIKVKVDGVQDVFRFS